MICHCPSTKQNQNRFSGKKEKQVIWRIPRCDTSLKVYCQPFCNAHAYHIECLKYSLSIARVTEKNLFSENKYLEWEKIVTDKMKGIKRFLKNSLSNDEHNQRRLLATLTHQKPILIKIADHNSRSNKKN